MPLCIYVYIISINYKYMHVCIISQIISLRLSLIFVIDVRVHARPYCNMIIIYLLLLYIALKKLLEVEESRFFLLIKLYNTQFVSLLRVICI